jgi:hypothetical protein
MYPTMTSQTRPRTSKMERNCNKVDVEVDDEIDPKNGTNAP